MNIVVEKYGGSSLATEAQINSIAQHVARSKKLGHQMVVVVSAMGKTTDDLISKAKSVNPDPDQRELSLLLSVGEIISASLLSLAHVVRSASRRKPQYTADFARAGLACFNGGLSTLPDRSHACFDCEFFELWSVAARENCAAKFGRTGLEQFG